MTNLIEVPGPGQANGRGADRVAAVLNAQRAAESWAARRTLSARSVIGVSAAMAYMFAVQSGCATSGARLVLASWVVAFGALLACAVAELRARRRVDALLVEAGGRRVRVAK